MIPIMAKHKTVSAPTMTLTEMAAALAKAQADLAAAQSAAPAPAKTAKTAKASTVKSDAAIIAAALDRYGFTRDDGAKSARIYYSVERPESVPKGQPFVITIQTPDGPVNVPPTLRTLIGAKMGVSDFVQTPTTSGKSLAWTSKEMAKRLDAAGFIVTFKGYLMAKADYRTGRPERGSATAQPVDLSTL